MAGDGKVVIDTELDPKGAESGMSKLGGTLAKVGGTAVKGAAIGVAAIGTSAVIAGKGLFDMAVQMADTGDNIGEMSEKIGISTKAYQEWGYILGQNGADVDILQMGIKTLSSAIFDASNGSQSAIDKFEYLGLSIDDLKNKSQEEIFDTVIAGLQTMPESAERTALAVDLLGKSATELQPILNKSADEITAYKDEAAELGFVMEEDTLQASSNLMDSIDNLQKSFMGAKNGIVGEFIPCLGLIVDGITEVVKGNEDGAKMIADGFNQLVQGLTSALPKIITFLNQVLSVILQNAPTIITTLIQGIIQSLPLLAAFLPQIVFALVDGIMLLLPALLSVGLQIIITLMQGLVENLPIMLPQLLQVVETIITMLAENLPLFVELAVQIIEIMATAILENQDMLVRVMSVLIQAMIQIIATLIPLAIQMVIDLLAAMMVGMSKTYPEFIKQGIEIVKSIISGFSSSWENMKKLTVQKFKELPGKMMEVNRDFVESGVKIAKGIIDGFAQKIGDIIEKVTDMKNQVSAQLADFNPLGAIGDAVKNGAAAILENVDMLVSAMSVLLQAMIQIGNDIVPQAIQMIIDLLAAMMLGMMKTYPEFIKQGIAIVTSIITGFSSFWSKMTSLSIQKFKEIPGKIKELNGEFINSGINIAKGIIDGFTQKIGEIIGKVIDMKNQVVAQLVSAMSVLLQAMIQIGNDIVPQAIQMIINLLAAMMLGMSKMSPEFIKQGIEIVKSVMSGFSSFWENMKKLTIQKFKELPTKIKELNSEFINSGVNIAKGIIDGFTQKIGEIIGKVIDMKNQISAQLADFNPLGAIGDAVKNGVSNITANMQVKSDAVPAQNGRPSNTMNTPSTNVYINTNASKLFSAVVEQNNGYAKGGYTPLASY